MENEVLDLSLMAADLNEILDTTNNTQHVAAPIDFTGDEQIASKQVTTMKKPVTMMT